MNKNGSEGRQPTGMSRRTLLQSAAGAAVSASLATFPGAGPAAAKPGRDDAAGRIVIDGLDPSALKPGFIKILETGGVDCVHKSVGSLESIASVYGFAYAFRDKIVVAKTVSDILQAREEGKRSIVMGAQSAENFQAALFSKTGTLGSFRDMARAVRNYKGLGLGIQGICYNTTNVFGSGCLDHKAPLTRAGRRLVEEIHKNNIILDVGGHTGERTSLDAIEMSSGVPIVCTHTNFAALNPNPRCISDRMAEAIAATGGVIGITAVSAFHTHNASRRYKKDIQATLSQHLDHYDYAKRLVGIEHVGLGPDFLWGTGATQRKHDPDNSAAFPADSMPVGLRTFVKDFDDISKLPNLIAGLKERGWTKGELDALLGGNWLRVYKKVWRA